MSHLDSLQEDDCSMMIVMLNKMTIKLDLLGTFMVDVIMRNVNDNLVIRFLVHVDARDHQVNVITI